jgi:hypothetical protein
MKPVATALLASLVCAAPVQAGIAVYDDLELKVPSTVVMSEAGPVFYRNVRFTTNADGSFSLAEAERRKLAIIESATVAVAGDTATVTAKGELTIACVALEEPAVVRKDDTFHVVLAETPIDPLALCMPFVAVTKFTQEVAIDTSELAPGEYQVDVNGVKASFTLTEASVPHQRGAAQPSAPRRFYLR